MSTRTPNQTLAHVAGTTTAHCVRRILAHWDRATADDLVAGLEWYAIAQGEARALAMNPYVGTLAHAAAILSAYSPRTTWQRNVLAARHFAEHGTKLGAAMASNHECAVRVAESPDPLEALTGPKRRAFARNILGDEDAVTVDVWAARIALGARDDVERLVSRVGMYDAIARAYRIAAEQRGVSPAVMQATTWVVARNGRAS